VEVGVGDVVGVVEGVGVTVEVAAGVGVADGFVREVFPPDVETLA